MIDWLSLPPLSALRAFAAFAQTGSVTQAGSALNVSHAAISQQLRALETDLGVALIDRSGRGMQLTADGRRLADAAVQGFETIARAVDDFAQQYAVRPLHVTTTPSFAASWLMARLPDFRLRHPDIDLVIDPTPELRDPEPGGVDAGLRYGNGNWPGLDAKLILPTALAVVAAPSLVGNDRIDGIEELLDLPWLQELCANEATAFLERHGLCRNAKTGLTSLPGNLMMDAARDGQGIAVVASAFVQPDIQAGRLRLLFEDEDQQGYFLITRPAVQRPALKSFCTWVMRQATKCSTT